MERIIVKLVGRTLDYTQDLSARGRQSKPLIRVAHGWGYNIGYEKNSACCHQFIFILNSVYNITLLHIL